MTGQDPSVMEELSPSQHPPQSSQRMSRWRAWATGLLLLFLVLGFALRILNLGTDSLWYDETVSVYLAGQPVPELIGHTSRDIHPPGYYLLLRLWLLLTGYPAGHGSLSSFGLETVAAFLSLAFGVLLIPLTWLLARRLRLGRGTTLLSAFLISISPFGIWYSQEVRMYTLGACLGVVCLLSTLPFLASKPVPVRRLLTSALLFAATAAAGLFVLYYFAFLLLAINGLVGPWLVWRWWQHRTNTDSAGNAAAHGTATGVLLTWLAAQALALILYLPWIPTAWRQATDPPVPAWRTPPELGPTLLEMWTALSFGQSANLTHFWPLLLITLGMVALGVISVTQGQRKKKDLPQTSSPGPEAGPGSQEQMALNRPSPQPLLGVMLLLIATFGPGLLILLLSSMRPLYHVRYMFTYSPTFSILLALGIARLATWRRPVGRWLAAAVILFLAAGSALSLRAFWTDPAYATDDHRSAVRELHRRWRPGDAILINAGYAYPALLTYWPDALTWNGRITSYDPEAIKAAGDSSGTIVIQVGHIDGDPALGWGDSRSDFYALPAQSLENGLEEISANHDRLWHYRIYDTVNDPQGIVREELTNNWTLVDDRVYAGEANMRVQMWQDDQLASLASQPAATFGGWLTMTMGPEPPLASVESGRALVRQPVVWRSVDESKIQPAALSLRLVDSTGQVWAAQDEAIGGNKLDLNSAEGISQPLYVEIPEGTPPGTYQLQLVIYDPQTGRPLPIQADMPASDNQLSLGLVEVARATGPTVQRPDLANFGPLRLIEATTPATAISPGDGIPLSLLWQAAPDFDGQAYVVVIQLLDGADNVAASLDNEPVTGRYPTSDWRVGQLVRDQHLLGVPGNTPPGIYRLVVGVYAVSDGQRLKVAPGLPRIRPLDYVEIADIEVQ